MGKIPRDLFEDELVPLFEKAGPIWDLRLMMDPLSGLNRGYAFLTFCTKEAAQEAVKLVRHSDHTGPFMSVYLLPLSSSIKLDSQSYLRISPENSPVCGKNWVVIDMGVALQARLYKFNYSIPVFLLSV